MGSLNLSSTGDSGPISSINVTPFVDVSLVLLVIFMVTAPVLMKDVIGIQLPKASSAQTEKVTAPLAVAVNRQGQILLNGALASPEAMDSTIREALKSNPDLQAVISADKEAFHGDVVKAIDLIQKAGLHRFALQIEREP